MGNERPEDTLAPVPQTAGEPGLTGTEAIRGNSPEELHQLDPRVVRLWRTTALLHNGILLGAGLAGGSLLHFYARLSLLIVIPAWLILALLFVLETLYLPQKRYQANSYRVVNEFVEFRSGLVWKTSVMIPVSRIQHIDLLRGPLERHYGLATLSVHTAGTSNASHKVSGLEAGTAIAVRETIMAAAHLENDTPPGGNPEG